MAFDQGTAIRSHRKIDTKSIFQVIRKLHNLGHIHASYRLRDRVLQFANPFNRQTHSVARLEKHPSAGPNPCRCAGENYVTGCSSSDYLAHFAA